MSGLLEDRAIIRNIRVCIDARLRASTAATGVATYADALVSALEENGLKPLLLDDATRGRFGAPSGALERAGRWMRAGSRAPVRLVADGRWLRARDIFRLAQARFDRSGRLQVLNAPGPRGVMHWTYPIPARIEGWINLYTVHDVIPLTHPELSDMPAAPLRARLNAIAESADALVTVSDASRRAIVATLGIAPDRVADCGVAVTGLDRKHGPLPENLAAGDYYLFCGMVEKRKNLTRIVAGWRASESARPLVIAGPPGDARIDLTGTIRVGYLPRGALLDLVAGARALVFPTLEEGFGLPVIEAMALGTPVITSDRAALAETAGGAALGVDPTDTGAIAAAITRIDRDDDLCGALRARGLERARRFTPASLGARLMALYAEFAGDLMKRP